MLTTHLTLLIVPYTPISIVPDMEDTTITVTTTEVDMELMEVATIRTIILAIIQMFKIQRAFGAHLRKSGLSVKSKTHYG